MRRHSLVSVLEIGTVIAMRAALAPEPAPPITLLPPFIPSTSQVFAPTVTVETVAPEPITLEPPFIASTAQVFAPTLLVEAAPLPITLEPPFIESASQVFPPTVMLEGETPAFSPDQIAGLEVWYNPDTITGLVDGQPITSWEDSSGNGRTLTIGGTGGYPPLYFSNTQNGRAVLRFTTAGGNLWLASPAAYNIQTAFGVTGNLALTPSGYQGFVTGGPNAILWTAHPGEVSWYISVETIFNTFYFDGVITPALHPAWHIYAGRCDVPFAFNSITIGTDRGVPGRTWQGDVGEILIYSTILTGEEQLAVENYLRERWGTPTKQQSEELIARLKDKEQEDA